MKTDKEKYLPREKVKLTISASDETGMPMPADVLVSVVDDQLLTFMNDKSSNILSWLLVETEIKGKVEEPRFYFDKTEPKAPVALDLLLKTSGWRRFTWETIKQVNLPQYQYSGEKLLSKRLYTTTYPPAFSNKELTGQVLINNSKEPLVNASVTLVRNSNVLANATTNETGHFKFTNLRGGKYDIDINLVGRASALITGVEVNHPHNTDLQVKFPLPDPAKAVKNKQSGVKVSYKHSGKGDAGKLRGRLLDQTTLEPLPFANVVVKQNCVQKGYAMTDINGDYAISPLLPGTYTVELPNVGYITKRITGLIIAENKTTLLDVELQENTTMLSEISVISYKAPLIGPDKQGQVITQEQIRRMPSRDVTTIANTAAGVMAREDNSVNVRGTRNSGTVYYVNGVKQLVAPSLPASSIDPKAGTTRNLDSQVSGKTLAKTAPKPTEPHDYNRIREFAAPVYAEAEPVTERTDFRKTLFWQPFVQIGRNGTTTLEFYTGDAITSYNILVEGLSVDGSPGRAEQKFFSQLPFSLAAKLPQATLENDRISVPLILKNNTEKEVSGKLEIGHPAGWKFTGKIPANHIIKPNSTQTLFLDYEVTGHTGAYDFAATFQADGLRDAFSQPVTVEQRGYPISQSIAGNSKDAEYQLDLSNMTAGTAQVSFVAYPSVVADLFKGIEGMLQEPYGCFEQTSSTSYPNLMVLDYLRETDKPDLTAMARAEELLEKGYNRLVTFETEERGYEWFGSTPAHEGLTAYGLLQFTDMQRVGGNVNAAMMARTKKWMLSRRDGKGGFKLSSDHGSSYGHADPAIANAYIMYALSEAGYKDLKPEMEAVYNSSLKSEDPYQLALVTNALLAAGDKKRGQELLANLLPKQAPDGSWTGTRHSVTHSTGKSLQVETTSLAVLAMLKSPEKNQAEL
ncbi:MAG TPA: carboxypeptidase regulatory-like domain-containing protein, partial [Adhaeribacter sp.]|nr:carboxypeptidase regulatory-like domain-containing protein [Adhaeribacter sp.]